MKSELSKRGFSQICDLHCELFLQELESVDHLFFSCQFVWNIWGKWCKIWEVQCALPEESSMFFMSWNSLCPKSNVLPLWKMAFFAMTWSIWIGRNEKVFTGKL
ncbi:hypothetical protein V6N11_028836 [Hibiscus sabdariffa]|uniref:Reverse transcriptase zinc-binding domain-containing protein n=1 Tax=Hibiscus sabdariffa TaxID=183260 RepID=A0ABR2PR27_9ROSI